MGTTVVDTERQGGRIHIPVNYCVESSVRDKISFEHFSIWLIFIISPSPYLFSSRKPSFRCRSLLIYYSDWFPHESPSLHRTGSTDLGYMYGSLIAGEIQPLTTLKVNQTEHYLLTIPFSSPLHRRAFSSTVFYTSVV